MLAKTLLPCAWSRSVGNWAIRVRGKPYLSNTGSPRLRRLLCIATVVSRRHNPDIAAQYQRLLHRGKLAMSAPGAAMRKLLHTAFGVLKHHTPYQPQATFL